MAAWAEGIDFTLEVAFGNNPYDASPTWTDISEYLCPWSVQLGRTSETNDFAPGTLNLQLRNDDRRFDPEHASGPYFGNLKPMVPIRLSATFSATTHVLFNGFVQGWPQQWGRVVGNAFLNCIDGSRAPENAKLTESVHQYNVEQDGPFVYWPMQNDDGESFQDATASDVDLRARDDATWSPPTESAKRFPVGAGNYQLANGSTSIVSASGETFSEPKAMEACVSMTADTSTGAISMSLYSSSLSYLIVRCDFLGVYVQYSNDTDNRRLTTLGGFQLSGPIPKGEHHLALRADTTNMYLIVDGVLVTTEALTVGSTTDTSYSEPRVYLQSLDDAGFSHVAFYADGVVTNADLTGRYEPATHAYGHPIGERTGERIGRVLDEIGFPSGKRTIASGETILGPYEPNGQGALDYIRYCEAAEQGLFFFDGDGNAVFIDRQQLMTGDTDSAIVFSDDNGSGDVKVADVTPDGNSIFTVRNIVTTSYSDVGAITRRDDTSITSHLEQREFIDAPVLPKARPASNLSAYVLRLRKDPLTRITELTISIRENPTDHFQVLGLGIGDVATFEWTPMNIGSALTKRLMVQGKLVEADDERLNVTLYLSPAVPKNDDVPYLTLGDATYGQIGATAANLVPY